jgi:hypothetical protein
MKSVLPSVMQAATWIFKEYKLLVAMQQKLSPLKLIEETKCKKTGATIFKIQIAGKSSCAYYSAKELYSDNKILENFSKIDVKIIVEAALKDGNVDSTNLPAYSLNEITFSKEESRRFYTLNYNDENISFIRKMSATEINRNKEVLMGLDKESIGTIAFQAGKESVMTEIESFKSAKQ